jgi:tRNA A37 threonylcarbamoyladenosine dehydratase
LNPSFQRLALLVSEEGIQKLNDTRVLVFGLGGVGSWCAEALVRSGLGHIGLVDSDAVCITNINRQAEASIATVGQPKAEALKRRLLSLNPNCEIDAFMKVYSKENAALFGIEKADYVIDAIDSLTFKLDLIEHAARVGAPLFSCMGMARKLDPTQIRAVDIWDTKGCPLAKLVRDGLRKRGFSGHFTAVYSPERMDQFDDIPIACGTEHCMCPARDKSDPNAPKEWCGSRLKINGSFIGVTAAAGMELASLVVQDVYRQITGDK